MREELLGRDPLWASVVDSEDLLTVHLYRQCATRIVAVVQILRGLNLDITLDEVRRYLKPALVMERELQLRSPTDDDLPVLDVFNNLWRRSKRNLVGDRGPDVLFDLTVGREDHFVDAVHEVVGVHVHGPSETGDRNQSGTQPEVVSEADQRDGAGGDGSDPLPEVRGHYEEELDYEADEPLDGQGESGERSHDESNSRVQSGEESEDSSSDSSSSSDNDDEGGSKKPLNRPSYATAAAGSPIMRKITVSKQPLYEDRAVADSSHGFVFLS